MPPFHGEPEQDVLLCRQQRFHRIQQRTGDHVSMGANAATKLFRIMDNLEHILAIELMNAAQGIDFRRPQKTSPILERFLCEYRKEVPFVKDDIVMYKEIHKTVAFLSRTKFDY